MCVLALPDGRETTVLYQCVVQRADLDKFVWAQIIVTVYLGMATFPLVPHPHVSKLVHMVEVVPLPILALVLPGGLTPIVPRQCVRKHVAIVAIAQVPIPVHARMRGQEVIVEYHFARKHVLTVEVVLHPTHACVLLDGADMTVHFLFVHKETSFHIKLLLPMKSKAMYRVILLNGVLKQVSSTVSTDCILPPVL